MMNTIKNNGLVFLVAILAAAIGLSASECSHSDDNAGEHLCGAYTEQRAITAEELELFNSIIGAIDTATEYTPLSVSTQVVAGLNYKFLCRYDDKTGTTGKCYVIIYQPLKGDPELIEIQKL